jgi:hypothetical protein
MQLRESLLSLIDAMRRRVPIPEGTALPQAANFIGWSDLLLNQLCGGGKNKELRAYLKTMAKETWQLVNWLTHDRNASSSAASISMHACDTLFGHFGQLLVRDQTGDIQNCPVCSSRNIRSHYDIDIPPEGSYFNTCGSCQWTNHPLEKEPRIETEVREPT